jgi:uncharacterized protein
MANGDLTLAAAFVAGVAGSVHCMAMCGGLTSAFGMRRAARRSMPSFTPLFIS